MAKKKTSKNSVETIIHDDAKGTNIPTAEVHLACVRNWAISAIPGLTQAPKRLADR